MENTINLKVMAYYVYEGKWSLFEKLKAKAIFNKHKDIWKHLFYSELRMINRNMDETKSGIDYWDFVREEMLPLVDTFNEMYLSDQRYKAALTETCEFALTNEKGGSIYCGYIAV